MYIENQSKLSIHELNDAVDKILEDLGNNAFSLLGYDIGPVDTPECFHCGRPGIVFVNVDGYVAWMKGKLIQEAFPEMPAERREQLLSGIHPECFDEMYSDFDDQDKIGD